MRCVKKEEFVRRLSNATVASTLYNELEEFLGCGGGPHTQVVCERIVHACYQRLEPGLEAELLQHLMGLVHLAVGGHEKADEGRKTETLNMEKILFHILQKLTTAGQQHCADLGLLLFLRLQRAAAQGEDIQSLVSNCSVLLWNTAKSANESCDPTHILRLRLDAVRSRLLQESVCGAGRGPRWSVYLEETLSKFQRACGRLSHTNADAIIRLLQESVLQPVWGKEECVCEPVEMSVFMAKVCKVLCAAEQWERASQLLEDARGLAKGSGEELQFALQLCDWSVQLHRFLRVSDHQATHTYHEITKLLSNIDNATEGHSQPLLEACQLVVWATECGPTNGMKAATLLASLSFLKLHQQFIRKQQENCDSATLQQTLCQSLCQGFSSTLNSLKKSQDLGAECSQQLVYQLKEIVVFLMEELQKLTNENLLHHAVSTVNGVVFELFNRKFHQDALSLVQPLCQQLRKSRPAALSTERVNHCFLQAVQSLRCVGDHQGALQAISDWLSCLTSAELQHLCSPSPPETLSHILSNTHPIKLWAKIKADVAKQGEDDLRLRTLRDGLEGAGPSDDALMMRLLEAELCAYGMMSQDLHEEMYNTLCDLLDLCAEEDQHTHTRAHTLLQLARVTCFHDLSQLTDCSPVDFAHEALRLLKAEPETKENADWLKDDTARASLWLYICQLEEGLQRAMATERRLQEEEKRRGSVSVVEPLPLNDLEQEEQEGSKESTLVYEGLSFNLKQHTNRLQALNESLSMWEGLIAEGVVPCVRDPAHTLSSLFLLASLYTLTSKPLEALRSYKLACCLSRSLGDVQSRASGLCHVTRLLLDLGEWEKAQGYLEQAEECVNVECVSGGTSAIAATVKHLKVMMFYSKGEVERGVCALCELLSAVEKRHSKNFYLLKAQTLHTTSLYLRLDTNTLPTKLRCRLTQQGLVSPDVAQYEAMKLLHSLVVMLLGNGFYGGSGTKTDSTNVTQDNSGEGLLMRYQLLWSVCVCARAQVCVRSRSGAIQEAKATCLEGLKLASKLQSLSQCAELLVCKAELELRRGATEECALDLQRVKHLLESCTVSSNGPSSDVKLNPRKAAKLRNKQAKSPDLDCPEPVDELEGLLSSRPIGRELVEGVGTTSAQGSSPPLKQRSDWLKNLNHDSNCVCAVCADPMLSCVCVRWALVSAALSSQTHIKDSKVDTSKRTQAALRRYRACVERCNWLSQTLGLSIGKLSHLDISTDMDTHIHGDTQKKVDTHIHPELRLLMLQAFVGQAECMLGKLGPTSAELWTVLKEGLKFVTPGGHRWAELVELKAELLALRGVAVCLAIAAKRCLPLQDLFSNAWFWNLPQSAIVKAVRVYEPPQSVCKTPARRPANTKTHTHTLQPPQTPAANQLAGTKASSMNVFKTPRASKSRPPATHTAAFKVFDFSPEHKNKRTAAPTRAPPCTPSLKTPGRGLGGVGVASFQVYEEASPTETLPPHPPSAPRRTKRSRFKVVFSDESDSDSEAAPVADVKKSSSPLSTNRKPASAQKVSQRSTREKSATNQSDLSATRGKRATNQSNLNNTRGKRATNKLDAITDSGVTVATTRPRRGRPKKDVAGPNFDEIETPRALKDEEDLKGDTSLENLHLSDTEMGDAFKVADECEILRRDRGAEVECSSLIDIRKATGDTTLTHTHLGIDVSLDSALSDVWSSWLLLLHSPPPPLFARLSAMLAVAHGNKDPITTAMLHANTFAITTRHHMTRHLAARKRKSRMCVGEMQEALESLSLADQQDEVKNGKNQEEVKREVKNGEYRPNGKKEVQLLDKLQEIFSFPSAPPHVFPHTHTQHFSQHIQQLPPGITVCMLSVVEACPGMIDTLLLTRLELDSTPITVRITTTHKEHSMSACVAEFESILEEQKQLNGVMEKSLWWEGRRKLDTRMQRLMENMQVCLGAWLCLLLPLTSDPELYEQLALLTPLLSSTSLSSQMLQVMLSAAPLLSNADFQYLAEAMGLSQEACRELQKAAAKLKSRAEPQGHTVLVLDKYLQKLPWENIACLRAQSVTRMPSLHAVLGHVWLNKLDSTSVLARGVDPKKVFYVLNPDGNLPNTEERFKDWFKSEESWQGVCGSPPDLTLLEEAIATKDIYIYVGHGAGARFLDARRLLKGHVRVAALLFGCSSAALSVNGEQEGTGIILHYINAGCPLVLGNLWDVTDHDMDRLTLALLRSWLSAGDGSSLLKHLPAARTHTRLTHMIGAATVVYGLPVHLG